MIDTTDVVGWLRNQLAVTRERAAEQVDKADALARLYEHALTVDARIGGPLTIDILFDSGDETERAELRALGMRAVKEPR